MGASYNVQGRINTQCKEYKKYKATADACIENEMPLPQKVADYFKVDPKHYDACEIEEFNLVEIPYEEVEDDCTISYVVDLSKIDKTINQIEFSISY